jgi:hypothetical protein
MLHVAFTLCWMQVEERVRATMLRLMQRGDSNAVALTDRLRLNLVLYEQRVHGDETTLDLSHRHLHAFSDLVCNTLSCLIIICAFMIGSAHVLRRLSLILTHTDYHTDCLHIATHIAGLNS